MSGGPPVGEFKPFWCHTLNIKGIGWRTQESDKIFDRDNRVTDVSNFILLYDQESGEEEEMIHLGKEQRRDIKHSEPFSSHGIIQYVSLEDSPLSLRTNLTVYEAKEASRSGLPGVVPTTTVYRGIHMWDGKEKELKKTKWEKTGWNESCTKKLTVLLYYV